MKTQRFLIVLTVINLAVLVITLAHNHSAVAGGVQPTLRGSALEIVDEHGRVRASLNVVPAGTQANGEPYPETVMLRMITERGRPSVKISASEQNSGLSFAGTSGSKDTYVILGSSGNTSSLKLRNEDGKEYVARP
jgi:hypothetical protein